MVSAIAENRFFYLRDCEASWTIIGGDARLSLEREAPQRFDVLALDAFTSDAIPVHLLTKEAVAIYGKRLIEEGVITEADFECTYLAALKTPGSIGTVGYDQIATMDAPDVDRSRIMRARLVSDHALVRNASSAAAASVARKSPLRAAAGAKATAWSAPSSPPRSSTTAAPSSMPRMLPTSSMTLRENGSRPV